MTWSGEKLEFTKNKAGKTIYTKEQKQGLMAGFESADDRKAFAEKAGVPYQTFMSWRYAEKMGGKKPRYDKAAKKPKAAKAEKAPKQVKGALKPDVSGKDMTWAVEQMIVELEKKLVAAREFLAVLKGGAL